VTVAQAAQDALEEEHHPTATAQNATNDGVVAVGELFIAMAYVHNPNMNLNATKYMETQTATYEHLHGYNKNHDEAELISEANNRIQPIVENIIGISRTTTTTTTITENPS
jgi:hypothetical protein